MSPISAFVLALAAFAAAGPLAPRANPDPATLKNLVQGALQAPTVVDRYKVLVTQNGKLLPDDQMQARTVFDFNDSKKAGLGGKVAAANINTFPMLAGTNIAVTVATLNACGLNTPHTHPRADEFLTVVSGQVKSGYIIENGLVVNADGSFADNEIRGTLKAFEGTVYPRGSIHYQFNDSCEPATFVAGLSSSDPGTSQIAQNFLGLSLEVTDATLGLPETVNIQDLDKFRRSLPANFVQAMEKCHQKCKGKGTFV